MHLAPELSVKRGLLARKFEMVMEAWEIVPVVLSVFGVVLALGLIVRREITISHQRRTMDRLLSTQGSARVLSEE